MGHSLHEVLSSSIGASNVDRVTTRSYYHFTWIKGFLLPTNDVRLLIRSSEFWLFDIFLRPGVDWAMGVAAWNVLVSSCL